MDIINLPSNVGRCRFTYAFLANDSPSNKTVLCTLAIIALTICLEVLANARLNCCDFGTLGERDKNEGAGLATEAQSEPSAVPLTATTTTVSDQPQLQPEPQAEPQSTSETNNSEATEKKSNFPSCAFCCYENPSPHIRANRFVVATILYSLILTVFILRIQDASKRPYVDILCRHLIHPPPPHWTAIAILNIIPFICASFAFLRTLVDCVLVRCGTGLAYNPAKGQYFWTPLMPFMIVFCAVYLLMECLKIPVACLMGDREVSLWTRKNKGKNKIESIEMQSEEAQGLVDNVDGPGDVDRDGDNGPPAYYEACTPRASMEGRLEKDSMV